MVGDTKDVRSFWICLSVMFFSRLYALIVGELSAIFSILHANFQYIVFVNCMSAACKSLSAACNFSVGCMS